MQSKSIEESKRENRRDSIAKVYVCVHSCVGKYILSLFCIIISLCRVWEVSERRLKNIISGELNSA